LGIQCRCDRQIAGSPATPGAPGIEQKGLGAFNADGQATPEETRRVVEVIVIRNSVWPQLAGDRSARSSS
jgi:hypothetical protein